MIPTSEMLARVKVRAPWHFWKRSAPNVVQRFGAVCVVGAVALRQDAASKVVTTYPGEYAGLPAAPPSDFREGTHTFPIAEAAPETCAACRGGLNTCRRCHGAGRVRSLKSDDLVSFEPCSSCSGRGRVRCRVCRGTAKTADVTLGAVIDTIVNMSDAFLSTTEASAFELAITRALESVVGGGWQKEQRIGLMGDASPYGRGAAHSEFMGFDYTQAMALAERFVANSMWGKSLMSEPPVAFVVPLLIAEHGGVLAAHFCTRTALVSVTEGRTTKTPL